MIKTKIIFFKGADLLLKNKKGQAPFDLIRDFEQWLSSPLFTEQSKEVLRGNSFKHSIYSTQADLDVLQS